MNKKEAKQFLLLLSDLDSTEEKVSFFLNECRSIRNVTIDEVIIELEDTGLWFVAVKEVLESLKEHRE